MTKVLKRDTERVRRDWRGVFFEIGILGRGKQGQDNIKLISAKTYKNYSSLRHESEEQRRTENLFSTKYLTLYLSSRSFWTSEKKLGEGLRISIICKEGVRS